LAEDALVQGVNERKLVGVHRDPNAVVLDVPPDLLEAVTKMLLPSECAGGMGGKGDQIGRYSEEPYAVLDIEVEYSQEACEITLDRGDQPVLRIRAQAEGLGRAAPDTSVHARVANLHRDASRVCG
jgi:hypothetical protein